MTQNTLQPGSEVVITQSPSVPERIQAFRAAAAIYVMTSLTKKHADPHDARREMGQLGQRYMSYLSQLGIYVEPHGFEQVDWDNIHLVLGNHQAFGLEAHLIHTLVPDASVVLKSGILRIPGLGKSIASTLPVEFDRNLEPKQALRDVQGKQVTTLNLGGRLVIFPEGTRLKDPKELLLPWSAPLYSKAYDIVRARGGQVAIITTNSMGVIPCTMEQALSGRGIARKGVVHIHLDLLPADVAVKEFNQRVMEVVRGNLQKSL